ncbi:ABC-type Fe3+ transport system protein; Molybdenum transport protein, putative [Candidatus Karelsulcia muelleri]|nr:ABC-type Fe3+ transport system protein; Molybdenum transport protein, putative [Candidatus Karelsulcia muelleri]
MKGIKNIYALYDDDQVMILSIKKLIHYGIKINEIYSPFPIHGINKLFNNSKENIGIGTLAFLYGLFGFIISTLLIWYSIIFDWPQNIGGKPYYNMYMNFPSFIPIIFEITIFCSAHFMCITYLFKCKLYPGYEHNNPDYRTTDDKFLFEIKFIKDFKYKNKILKKNGVLEINLLNLK